MLELHGYITNLGKYNEGELVGEWVKFPISEDEQKEIFERIGINEEYEEYFFTDWDCEVSLGLGEFVSIDHVNDLGNKLEGWDTETLIAVCEVWYLEEILNNDPDDYRLLTDVFTDDDLGYYLVEESGIYDLTELGALKNYIDYEKFGRDVRLESNGGHTNYGFIEYIG